MDERITITPKAQDHLRDLVIDESADDTLLDNLYKHLQAIAASPTQFTEQARYPYPENRLMANFECRDSNNHTWRFTVTLRRQDDEVGILILTIRGAKYNI